MIKTRRLEMIKGFDYYTEGTGDVKQTPNQMAKNIILDAIFNSPTFWSESSAWNADNMTEIEKEKITKAIERQTERVCKLMNL